jgi:hypothetical protein
VYLINGGLLEYALQMAARERAPTTKFYDQTSDEITLDEVERIVIREYKVFMPTETAVSCAHTTNGEDREWTLTP